ncbi:MAG: choice-of-anchor V domain-containing protein [Acidobacteriota bacterium]
MHRRLSTLAALSVLAVTFTLLTSAIHADVTGAGPKHTGAPGEDPRACTECHLGTALNGGPGNVKITLPGAATYSPGVAQKVQIEITDPGQRRWGFELTARLATDPATLQAGDLNVLDSNTRVFCADTGRVKPCGSSSTILYATHTESGTRLGTASPVTFDVEWTPPASGLGDVKLYVAANASNGDDKETSGDHIYTAVLDVAALAGPPKKPQLAFSAAVVNGASFQPGIAPGSWTTIRGTDLSSTTRAWTGADIPNGNLPTSLDGVTVTVNNKPAFVNYISPTQINVLAPEDASTGPVIVQVSNNGQTSDPAIATLAPLSPAFFAFDGKYLAATHADGSLLGKAGLFPTAPAATTPAKAGETIILYGTGFGPTNPKIPVAQLATEIGAISTPYTISIGGSLATVSFGGLVPPFAQLYQFNVQVPAGLAAGDHAVVAQINGISSPTSTDCCFITVQ